MTTDVAQQKHVNKRCYASSFRYCINIYIEYFSTTNSWVATMLLIKFDFYFYRTQFSQGQVPYKKKKNA